MHRGFACFLCLALSAPALADSSSGGSSFDVAPTTLDLKAGEAGLFYVTNHGARPVTVQIEALDWGQTPGRPDTLAPSQTLFTSPPLARIFPGTRQSVRVLARPAGDRSESAYRLRVSELPDPQDGGNDIRMLLQFSVPVFVDHDSRPAPDLAWEAARGPDGLFLTARNRGPETVKLTGLALGGARLGREAFVYILPGAAHRFGLAAAPPLLHVSGHDARSGRDVAADLTLRP